jgi:hypothetical protein
MDTCASIVVGCGMAKRDYTTWEEDLTSMRAELHGYNEELVAIVDKVGKRWVLYDKHGVEVAARNHKEDVQRLALQLL